MLREKLSWQVKKFGKKEIKGCLKEKLIGKSSENDKKDCC